MNIKLPRPIRTLLLNTMVAMGQHVPIAYLQGMSLITSVMTGQEDIVRRLASKHVVRNIPKDMRETVIRETMCNIERPGQKHTNPKFQRPDIKAAWQIFDCIAYSNGLGVQNIETILEELVELEEYQKVVDVCRHHSTSLDQDNKIKIFTQTVRGHWWTDEKIPTWASDQLYDAWQHDLPGWGGNSEKSYTLLAGMCAVLSERVLCHMTQKMPSIAPEQGAALFNRKQLSADTISAFVDKGWDINKAIAYQTDLDYGKDYTQEQLMNALLDYNEVAHTAVMEYQARLVKEILIDSIEHECVSSEQLTPQPKRKM